MPSLHEIPTDPTAMWIIAAAIVLGGSMMAFSLKSAFRVVKETSGNTTAAVTQMLGFCEKTAGQHESALQRICKAHEKVGTEIAREVRDLKVEIARTGAKTSEKLEQIHQDIIRGD